MTDPAGVGGRAGAPRLGLHADIPIAAAILVFCALVYAVTLTFDEVPASLAQGMGPGAFPRLLLGVMAVLALALGWSARGRPSEPLPPIPPVVYLTALAFLLAMGVISLLGMMGLAFVAVVGIGRLWGERRWPLLAASGVFLGVAIHLVFVRGFGIALPRGLLTDALL